MCGSVISITLCLGGVFARLAFPSISANHLSPSTTNTQIFATVTPDLCSSLLSQSIHTLAVQRPIFILTKKEIFSIGYFTHVIPLLMASNWESHVIYSSTTFGTICVVANFANFRVHACDGCSSRQMGRKSRKMEELASLFHHIASTCITNFCTKMWLLFTLSFFLIHCTSQGSHFVWHVSGAKLFCHFSLFQSVTCTIVIISHRYIEVVGVFTFCLPFLECIYFSDEIIFFRFVELRRSVFKVVNLGAVGFRCCWFPHERCKERPLKWFSQLGADIDRTGGLPSTNTVFILVCELLICNSQIFPRDGWTSYSLTVAVG